MSSNQGGALCARCSSIHHLLEYFQRESLSLTTIVLWPILYRTQVNLFLSIFLLLLNVGSRSSSIMILENRIRLIEIQLRCQTLFNSLGNKSGRGRRTNSDVTLFVAWRLLLRNYVTVINPVTISDVNSLLCVICNSELQPHYELPEILNFMRHA